MADPRTDTELIPSSWMPLPPVVYLGSLALLTWGVVGELPHPGSQRVAAFALLGALAAAWCTWVFVRNATTPAVCALAAMAVTGGALAAITPVAMVAVAVATLSTAARWRLPAAAAVGLAGWLATCVTVVGAGTSFGIALGAASSILAGLVVGFARRQAIQRTEQAARVEVESARAEVERARAEVLDARNHLARELHDVLAHTLAALSVQLEAFGTVIEAEPETSPAVREQFERTRRLVREGFDEARSAVAALRDDPAPLDEQLQRLSGQHQADFTTSGPARPLAPQIVTGLYRVAQEALTNAMKHAARAPTSVHVRYAPDAVEVSVENGAASVANPLGTAGGGYGLRGIAERLALLDGTVEAGPTPDGWRVRATVPLPVERVPARRQDAVSP